MNKALGYAKKYWNLRFLIGELVKRDLKLKYRRSALGYLWSLLNPLLTMIVVSTVFSFIFKQEIENFPVYLLIGQISFQFFAESTSMAMGSVIQNAQLLKKVYVPKFVFPVSRVISSGINLVFSLGALFIVMIILRAPVNFTVLLLPLPIIATLVFSLGIGLILSVWAVYFRDLLHLYGVFTTLLMYLTPIFYPISLLPSAVAKLVYINPLTQFVTFQRAIVLEGRLPSGETLALTVIYAALSLFIGASVFRRRQRKFMLYI